MTIQCQIDIEKRDEAQDDRTEKVNSAMCPFIAMYPASNNQLVPLFAGVCKIFFMHHENYIWSFDFVKTPNWLAKDALFGLLLMPF